MSPDEVKVDEVKVGDRVTVEVESGAYACCGGGWRMRGHGKHTGQVTVVSGRYFVLQGNALGTTFQLVADHDKIISVHHSE